MVMSKKLELIINSAIRTANKLKHEYLTLEAALHAMLKSDEQVIQVVRASGASPEDVRAELGAFIESSEHLGVLSEGQVEELSKRQFSDEGVRKLARESGISYRPEISMALQRVIQRAALHVQAAGKQDIRGINLLVAMFHERESFAIYTLVKRGVRRLDVVKTIAEMGNLEEEESGELQDEEEFSGERSAGGSKVVEQFCVDLIGKAMKGRIDPLIGRKDEVERIIQVLCRRRKNNPLLVGEAGVGKTALAEGLASALAKGEVPEVLQGAVLFSLDMASLVAGAKFRGEFEQRIKTLVKELENLAGQGSAPILYIDEIHTVIGAGATNGSGMDASNLLRPVLSGGVIRIMGSVTDQEYRKFIERDGAFGRRFQKIAVEEPSDDETYAILKGLRERFEKHHEVKYPNGTLKAAVRLSGRYISDRRNPDRAIDIIDEAGARARLLPTGKRKGKITLKDIETIVAKFAKVPKISVVGAERDKLRELGDKLKRLIYGQDHAIDRVKDAILLSRSGLEDRNRPMAAFLFAGPTGVGKTELARQLALHLGSHLARFDMSEYLEKHSIARLIGAPPGYVGHESGGQLTDAVKKYPHCVLLLDEMEKAHQDIFNVFLQVMDYGKLTDSHGRTTDFRNVIIIMTTNAGAKEMESGSIGLSGKHTAGSQSHRRDQAIRNFFTPEFRNRLDAIIHFNPLDEDYVLRIVEKFIFQLENRLKAKNVVLEVTEKAKRWMAKRGYDPKMGARELSRIVDNQLKRPLAGEILFGALEKGGEVIVDVDEVNKKLSFQFKTG